MRSIVSFFALFATWLALSGHLTPWFLASGVLCSALVVALMNRLRVFGAGPWPLNPWKLTTSYLPWLGWQVVKASADVAWRVWHPSLPVQPRLLRVSCRPRTAAGAALLANSITLTPGTVTVAIDGDDFVVHSLSDAATRSLVEGHMQDRVIALERGP